MPEQVNSCAFCNPIEVQEKPLTLLNTCKDCGKEFCLDHSSKFDPQHCQECNKDVTITDRVYNKTTEEYDEFTDEFVLRASKCRVTD
jgi:hypothetical protein